MSVFLFVVSSLFFYSEVPITIERFHEQPITEAVATYCGQPLDLVPKSLVMKASWQPKCKQDHEAHVLKVCDGMFGLPRFVRSFDGYTNFGYLPRDDRAEGWKNWQQPEEDSFLDHRTLNFTVCSEVGETLEYCATPLELIIALRDAFFGRPIFDPIILALIQLQAGSMPYSTGTCIETSALVTFSG